MKNLLDNQILMSALLLMLSGAVMALLRKVPGRLFEWAKRRLILTVEIHSHDRLYGWVQTWLDAQSFTQNCRALTASSGAKHEEKSESITRKRPKILFIPAPGIHVFWYGRRLIILNRERQKSAGEGNDSMRSLFVPAETMTITILGRSPQVVRHLIEEAVDFAQPPYDPRITVTVSVYGYWRQSQMLQPRSLESVILPFGLSESLLEDVQRFLSSENYYRQVGIPYRRGWLLHGIPGSGKSSLIVALAGHLHLNINVLNIASKGMNDERLNDLLADVPAHTIVLLEDVDATFDGREKDRDDKSGVTFSGLLNALDGVASKEGRLLFMTTNHLERLDPALTRPGRVDMSIEFGYANQSQIQRLYVRFFPNQRSEAVLFASKNMGNVSMAEIQERFLAMRNQSQRLVATAAD